MHLTILDNDHLQRRAVTFTRPSDRFDEAREAESIADWVMEPRE